MQTEKNDALEELILTLEACRERIQGIQQETERGLMLINLALSGALHQRKTAVPRDALRDLLDAHHARLTDSLLTALRPGEPGPGAFRLFIDREARTAKIGRRHIPLTEAEYKVLELLWTKSPDIVSRRMLLDHLYGGRDEPGEEVLDVFIFHVRQKLRNAGCTDASVESVRGRGWYLELGKEAAPAESEAEERAG